MKFKVGDKVVGNKRANDLYGITKEGWIGTVTKLYDKTFNAEASDGDEFYGLGYDDFDLYQEIKSIFDLQFADVVTLRNGEKYVVADDTLYGEDSNYDKDAHSIFAWYNNDLTQNENDRDEDIVKVERNGSVIYERKETEVKEMTVAEISKALGYEVKVVK